VRSFVGERHRSPAGLSPLRLSRYLLYHEWVTQIILGDGSNWIYRCQGSSVKGAVRPSPLDVPFLRALCGLCAYDALPHAAMRQAYGLALGTAEDLEARTRHVRFPQSVLPSGSLCFRFARLVPGTVR